MKFLLMKVAVKISKISGTERTSAVVVCASLSFISFFLFRSLRIPLFIIPASKQARPALFRHPRCVDASLFMACYPSCGLLLFVICP